MTKPDVHFDTYVSAHLPIQTTFVVTDRMCACGECAPIVIIIMLYYKAMYVCILIDHATKVFIGSHQRGVGDHRVGQ